MHRLITSICVNAAFSTRDARVLSFIQLSLAISIARLFPFLKHDIIAVVSSSRASHHCVGETSFCVLYFFFFSRKNERAVPSCRQLRRRTFVVQFSPPTTVAKTKAVPEARVPNQRGRVRGANGRRKQRAGESTKAEKSERCSQRRFEAVRGTDEECINHHHERQVFLVLGGRRGRRRGRQWSVNFWVQPSRIHSTFCRVVTSAPGLRTFVSKQASVHTRGVDNF